MRKEKVTNVIAESISTMNTVVLNTAKILEEGYFVYKIDELLKERGLTQKELAQMTGMRVGTISNLVNGKGTSINKTQLVAIMAALRVTKLDDIMEFGTPEMIADIFEKHSSEWIEDKRMPLEVRDMYRKNILKSHNLL